MAKLVVNRASKRGEINRHIYGHFAEHLGRCIYGGLFVGEDSPVPNVRGMRSDVVAALRHIRIPNLRWPGGCFADEYHWQDGIGPAHARGRMVNTNWGHVVEDNSFGTHEFLDLCDQLGCEPYINGNMGSGTVREMSEWVEYLNSDGDSSVVRQRRENGRAEPFGVRYFGVGNENWGCGGNMRPEYYADEYRRYQTYCRSYGDRKLYKIACGSHDDNTEWTDTVMRIAGRYMDALTLHYYTIPSGIWAEKGSATQFSEEEYYATLQRALRMDDIINRHLQVMDRHDPEHRVGLIVDEWGTWFDVEPGTNPGFLYQQNTMRDALVAAATLNVFNSHCDRVVMANLAQTVNVLQAVILTEGDRMLLTPTYHVFDLYKSHQGASLLDCSVETATIGAGEFAVPDLHASASEDDQGVAHITIANLSATEARHIECDIAHAGEVRARILSGAIGAFNTFDEPDQLAVAAFDGIEVSPRGFSLTMPACSVMEIAVQ